MRQLKHKVIQIVMISLLVLAAPLSSAPAFAGKTCGSGDDAVKTAIDLGCKGGGCGQSACNPIYDLSFSIIRFLSNGVGLFIVGSLIFAGIQFSASRGDPKASEDAQNRIQSALIALLIFIFAWAMLNYLLPVGIATKP